MAYRENPPPWMSGNGVGCPGKSGLGCPADCLRECPMRSGASGLRGLGGTVWRVTGVTRADADGYNVDLKEVQEGVFSDDDTGRRKMEYWFASAGRPPNPGDDWNEFQEEAISGWEETEVGAPSRREPSTLSSLFGGISSIVEAAAPSTPGLVRAIRGEREREDEVSLRRERREPRGGGIGLGTILLGLGVAGAAGGAIYFATRK